VLQEFAAAIGLRAVTLQRKIELQDLRAKRLRCGSRNAQAGRVFSSARDSSFSST
jgi:hypothetical protein